MNKGDIIYLWKDKAPYTDECGGQAQPSIKAFPVEGSRGAVVVCPGGGYCMKAQHEGDPISEMLNQAGISAFTLDYRVRPCPYDAPLTDALRAIRLVRSFGYEKVAILGFSAGGNLTCSAATLYTDGNPDADDPIDRLSSRPDAFIPCYAVVSFISYEHCGSRYSLLGDKGDDLALVRRFSAELNVTRDTPPAFIWHTADDGCVPVENSLMLARALAEHGVPFEMHIFPHGYHGLGLATGLPDVGQWPALCQKWLTLQGYGKPQA
jgi:acetyl esterase/lipase